MQAGDFNTHLHAQSGIEVRQWFVQQEYARFGDQRTANRHTLTLSAGKRFWFTLQQVCQLQNFRNLVHALVHHLFFRSGQFEAERHVFRDGQMGIQRVGLKDHAYTTFGGRNVVHPGLPDKQVTTGDGFKSGDHTQQGRLTAA